MIIIFEKMVENNTNLSIKNGKLVYQLQTENLEDVFVGVTADEIDVEEVFIVGKDYSNFVWKILFEKTINKYQQARTQLIKKC